MGAIKKYLEVKEVSRPRRFPPVKALYTAEKRFSDPVRTNYFHRVKIIAPEASYPPDNLETARKYVLLYVATANGYLTLRLSYSDLKDLAEFLISVVSDSSLVSALREQKLIPVPIDFYISNRRKSAGSSAENREAQSIVSLQRAEKVSAESREQSIELTYRVYGKMEKGGESDAGESDKKERIR